MNPAKSFTPAAWATNRLTLAAVFLISLLIPSGSRRPIAAAVIDPVLSTPAQDEALYTHSVLRMAAGEDWLTPRFLGRLLLVKPPLLQWLSALSVKTFGAHRWALRLPSIAAAAGVLTIVYYYSGPVGWLLLASCNLWRERAGLMMMDDLLTLFYLLALIPLKGTGRYTALALGAFTGLAVMTKWFAGLLPLAMLLYARPPLSRWLQAALALCAVALPWHVYEYFANRQWFLAEYLGVELFGYAFDAPVQSSQESWFSFYAPRLAWLAPLAIPLLLRRVQTIWLIWTTVLLAAIAAYSYRNTTYLVPLAPALLLSYRGWIPPVFAPLALAALLPWPQPQPYMPVTEDYRGREVLHLDPDDQLRTSLLPGATVRYIFLIDHLPPNGQLDFEQLGVAKPVDAFLRAPDAKVDVVLAKDLAALRTLIESSPQRDFLLPHKAWRALAFTPPHEVIDGVKVRLKSRNPSPGPRPAQIVFISWM